MGWAGLVAGIALSGPALNDTLVQTSRTAGGFWSLRSPPWPKGAVEALCTYYALRQQMDVQCTQNSVY